MDPADDSTRATNPDNWNAMLAMDVAAYQEQAEEILGALAGVRSRSSP